MSAILSTLPVGATVTLPPPSPRFPAMTGFVAGPSQWDPSFIRVVARREDLTKPNAGVAWPAETVVSA